MQKVSGMTDAQINEIIGSDPDLYHLADKELAEFHLVREDGNERGKQQNKSVAIKSKSDSGQG